MKKLVFLSVFWAVSLASQAIFAFQTLSSGFKSGQTGAPAGIDQILPRLESGAGGIVVLGENHGLSKHQFQQMQIIQELARRYQVVSVGLEFLSYPDQAIVDQWRSGFLDEAGFLKTINWGQPSFDFYRDQAQFPVLSTGARTVALNAPRSLTSKIAKSGLGSLTLDEISLMPPHFSLGRDSYKQRFAEIMPHLPEGKLDQYFAAQSTWDDTMAWIAVTEMQRNPNQVLVIIVGDFHVQYGGGLIDRILARAPGLRVESVSQVDRSLFTDDELILQIGVHPIYGKRANWIWIE